jgi:hypothetical protein
MLVLMLSARGKCCTLHFADVVLASIMEQVVVYLSSHIHKPTRTPPMMMAGLINIHIRINYSYLQLSGRCPSFRSC